MFSTTFCLFNVNILFLYVNIKLNPVINFDGGSLNGPTETEPKQNRNRTETEPKQNRNRTETEPKHNRERN